MACKGRGLFRRQDRTGARVAAPTEAGDAPARPVSRFVTLVCAGVCVILGWLALVCLGRDPMWTLWLLVGAGIVGYAGVRSGTVARRTGNRAYGWIGILVPLLVAGLLLLFLGLLLFVALVVAPLHRGLLG